MARARYVVASLGCLMGVMRSPLTGYRPLTHDPGMSQPREVDLFFMGNREAKKRLDEVDRVVRWGRLAKPFGARAPGGADMKLDTNILLDAWDYEPGDTWDKKTWGATILQGAPARVTRGGLPLPVVTPFAGVATPLAPIHMAPCGLGNHSAQASPDPLQQFAAPAGGGGEWRVPSTGACLTSTPGRRRRILGEWRVHADFGCFATRTPCSVGAWVW